MRLSNGISRRGKKPCAAPLANFVILLYTCSDTVGCGTVRRFSPVRNTADVKRKEATMPDESLRYRRTIGACFIGYVIQSCICTFAPLLYVRFQNEFTLTLQQISNLITLTFFVQLMVDLLSTWFVDRVGYRICVVSAHALASLGFLLLAFLPSLLHNAYTGLILATVIYSTGAGLIEVLISPIIEACPTKRKAAMMNLLHSFFGWGQMLVVLVSTAFFSLFGIQNWRIMACIWAALPAANAFLFVKTPLPEIASDDAPAAQRVRALVRSRMFWLLFLLMVCAGACELAVSQWASALIETELGVSKTVGDLAGPCLFALFMAVGRLIGTRFDDNDIETLLHIGGAGCLVSYLFISLAPWSWLSLAGCALCGLSVSVMWPATISLASQSIRGAGTALFSLLALAGDIGCTAGPTWTGFCAGLVDGNLKIGILLSLIFPIVLLLGLQLVRLERNRLNRYHGR